MNQPKIILITGASSGMGKNAALSLIEKGHIVYGAARRIDQMQDLVSAGGHAILMDLQNSEQVRNAVKKVLEEQGRIDVLINNAGYAVYGAVEDVDLDTARRQFDVNLFGLAEITKQVIPQMRKQGSGRIINISSMGGKIYTPLGAWYHASKHALEGWSDCLRIELRQFGIDVVIIEPGLIRTEFGEVMHDPLVKRSKGSPYEKMANQIAEATKASYNMGQSSPPDVVTRMLSKAINAERPKTRYSGGKMAKQAMFLRKWLGDRIFDRFVMMQV